MTKDMTQGSPLKLILAFAVPLMLGSLFQQFYNLADTIIVGRFVGVEALAAVGSVGGLNYLVLGFVNGIACGFSIPISWTFGAKDYKEMRRYTANTVWLSIFFAVVLTIVTVALTRSVLVWTNTPENIIDLADIYIRTIFAGIPFTLLYNVTSALMRALGDSKRPLYFLLVASFLNIGLDLVCIIVFQMGAFGAAFATVVSQAVAGLGSLLYILRHYPELRWSREEGCFSLTHCAKLCSMGIPMGLQCSITAIGSVVLQGAVNGLGSDIVAAQTAGGKAAQFLCVPLESIGTAMTTYASQNMGAKDLDRVDRGVYTALGIGCVYSVASFLILRVTDKLLIGLFLDARRDRHYGQCPELHLLEQRILHPAGGAHYLPLHHSGSGLLRPCHVCRCGRDDRPRHGGLLVRAAVGLLCGLHRKPGGMVLCLLLPHSGLLCGAQTPAEGKGRREGTRCPHRKRLKNVRKLSCKGELFCCSGCRVGRVLGAFSANSPEPTVPPLCLRTGPHFPDIRWRNSQPTALGFRELYQVLLWECYLRKLLILNDMTIKKQLCQCDKVALF